MKKTMMILLCFSSFLLADNIKIAVAANVSYAINDLIDAFNQQYPKTKVQVTLGSSGKLTAQITHGAPYDLFMSANMKYPQALYDKQIAIAKPFVYAQGSLAMLGQKPQDFSQGIHLLTSNNIKRIALANPKTAPYGKAAVQALKKVKLYTPLKPKYIYGESIAQTVSYTLSAADIGLIAKSSLYSPKMRHFKKDIHWRDVNSSLYTPINQGMVILKRATHNTEVKAFYDFMLGQKAKTILKDYGYLIP